MEIIDSHCHIDQINLDKFGGSIQSLLTHAKTLGVTKFLCVCITLNEFPNIVELIKHYESIFGSVGIHPTEPETQGISIEQLISLAKQDNKIIAIGETGLDYYRSAKNESNWQRIRFIEHIEVANTINKPLIIHCREAKQDVLTLLKEQQAKKGVMHCFVEDWQTAKTAMNLGFYISFSGIITFKNAKDICQVAQKIPDDYLLVETDSPYLAPMPFRGKENSPAYTRYVVDKLAEIRQTTPEHIAEITTKNFNHLFFNE